MMERVTDRNVLGRSIFVGTAPDDDVLAWFKRTAVMTDLTVSDLQLTY